MPFLQLLYGNLRFRKFFTVEPDVMETFLALAFIILGYEMVGGTQLGMGAHPIVDFLGYSIPMVALGWFSIIKGFAKLYFWYENIWRGRRFVAMLGIIAWLFIFYVAHFLAPHTAPEANGWVFLLGVLGNTWLYLRLGLMSDNDRH